MVCAITSKLNQPGGKDLILTFSYIQPSIKIVCEIFTISAAWLYITCNQTLTVLYKKFTLRFAQFQDPFLGDIAEIVYRFECLQQASGNLKMRFGLILTANCCYIILILISSPYYLAQPNFRQLHYIVWDTINMIEPLIRLIFICQSSDAVRCSVSAVCNNLGFLTLLRIALMLIL